MAIQADHKLGDYKTTSEIQLLFSKRGDRVVIVNKTPEGFLHYSGSTCLFTEADFENWTPIDFSYFVGRNPEFPLYQVEIRTDEDTILLVSDADIFQSFEGIKSNSDTWDKFFLIRNLKSIRVENGGSGGVSGYCDRLKSQLYDLGIDVTFDYGEVDSAQNAFFNSLSTVAA